MNIAEFAASPIFSGIVGGLGSIITGVLGFFQKRDDNRFALLRMDKERELLQLQSGIDQAKLSGLLAINREQGASDAFTSSIQAEGKIKGEHKWASTLRAVTRPLLTWFYQFAFCAIFAISMVALWQKWATEAEIMPLIQYMVIAVINIATTTVTWWFGQRQMDKVMISWGNKVSGASVGTKTETPKIK